MADAKTYKEMFEKAVHVGHRTHKWNPKMKKYIYGEKSGIHLINLETTAEHLEKALDFLISLKKKGKTLLFVSTKPQAVKLLEGLAKDVGMPYVVAKWIPGLITNFDTLKTRIKYLLDLEKQEENGEFTKYTKKEVSGLKKEMQKLELALGGVKKLKSKPDAIFVLDVCRDSIAVSEANKVDIPVVGIVDTNADPDKIDYPIPANDDSLTSLEWLLERVRSALK